MASQALFLIHKHLPHFLYPRKAVSPGRLLSRSYLYFTPKNAAAKHASFPIATARAYGLATMDAVCLSSLRDAVCEQKTGSLWLLTSHLLLAPSHLRGFRHLCSVGQTWILVVWYKKSRQGLTSPCCPLLPLPCSCCSWGATAIGRVSGWTSPARGIRETEPNLSD